MMAEHQANLGMALGIFSLGFLVIGPNILAVIGTSMAQGRRNGAKLALGIGLGSGIWPTRLAPSSCLPATSLLQQRFNRWIS